MSEERGIGGRSSNSTNTSTTRTNHLLIIGIDAYKNGVRPLKNAVRDAEAFKAVLMERFQFTEANCITLINEQATKKAIIKAFDQLIDKLTTDDNLLLYFSGHGELIDRVRTDKGYWIPADAVLNERDTYLPNDEIRDFFANLSAHHVFGIIDSCFSGSLLLRDLGAAAKRYYNIPSRWVMTSGMKEPVMDGSGEHSPFALSLLTQLRNYPEQAFSISELWLQMREGIVTNAKQSPLCQPIHDAGHQGGEYFFLSKDVNEVPVNLVSSVSTSSQRAVEATTVNSEAPSPPVVVPEKEEIPTDLPGLKKYLKNKIVQDKLDEVFEILYSKINDDSQHQTTVMIRMSAYNGLKKDIANGIAENATMRMAQIKNAVLYVISEMEEEDL